MSRYHFWGFIVNQAGEPIENAGVTLKRAGTDDLADVYFDEFEDICSCDIPALSAGPHVHTLSNGYYEFWVGDRTEINGYENDQKFKLEWEKPGIAYGMVDFINIFPLGPKIEEVGLDCIAPTETKNKLISNLLACKWDSHTDQTIVTNNIFTPMHGIEYLNPILDDTTPNKIISNYYGNVWETHRYSTIQEYGTSAYGPSATLPETPHGIEELNLNDPLDDIRNKVVSNYDIYSLELSASNLNQDINNLYDYFNEQIENIWEVLETSRSGWFTIYNDMLVHESDDIWYVDINHELNVHWPFVAVWDVNTSAMIQPSSLINIDENILRIKVNLPGFVEWDMESPTFEVLQVRIGNGGVQIV